MATDKTDRPGVIAPPPLIYLVFILIGVGLELVWPTALAPIWARWPVGGSLIVIGIIIVVTVFRRFRQAGTNIEPYKPTTAIVTDGLFRFSRNPVYVAGAAAHFGIAIAADSLWILELLLPALLVIRYGVIAREERYLEAKFGEEYLAYKARVRRWF